MKTLTKHISCELKYKLDKTKCMSNQWWNNDNCQCTCKKRICKKECVWNPRTCICENGKYLASVIDDSAIICDKVILPDAKLGPKDHDETKIIPTNFNGKKAPCKTQNFYILLGFLLIAIALLITVSIYCYLIKYWTKQLLQLPCQRCINTENIAFSKILSSRHAIFREYLLSVPSVSQCSGHLGNI